MEFIPFEKLNRELSTRLKNTELYTDESYSFLKIVQHGLSYAMLDSKNKLLKTYFRFPFFVQLFLYRLKGWLKPKAAVFAADRPLILFDEGRHFETDSGKIVSMYFDKLIHYFGRENCFHVGLGGDKRISFDLKFNTLSDVNGALDGPEKHLLKSICNALMRLQKSNEFSATEMLYIESAFHVFFNSFRKNYSFLKRSKAQRAFFCVHYHKEGLLAALKVLGIEAVEVQHGLISRNDFYYVYDSQFRAVIKRAFFPDKLLLYGSYWKEVLSSGAEWERDQLIVAGNYLANARKESVDLNKKENIIFIGAQKNLAQPYVEYCLRLQKLLKEKEYDWWIVVKMHPLEKTPDLYKNALPPAGVEVVGSETNLYDWLAISRIQISIYSTTFFDALGFNVLNFSLQNYTNSADYAREMVEEGVALALELNEDPVAKFEEFKGRKDFVLSHDEVYSTFPGVEFQAITWL